MNNENSILEKKYSEKDIVDLIIGYINPDLDPESDERINNSRFNNLKIQQNITYKLLKEIEVVSESDNKKFKNEAESFLNDIKEEFFN